MGLEALQLKRTWPLAIMALVFLVGLALEGFGAGMALSLISVIVVGPGWLLQNAIRRRRGTLLPPPPKTPENERAEFILLMRLASVAGVFIAIKGALLVTSGYAETWFGEGANEAFLLWAVLGIAEAGYTWALAEAAMEKTSWRWAMALSGVASVAFVIGALTLLLANHQFSFVDPFVWKIILVGTGLIGLQSAYSSLRTVVRNPTAPPSK